MESTFTNAARLTVQFVLEVLRYWIVAAIAILCVAAGLVVKLLGGHGTAAALLLLAGVAAGFAVMLLVWHRKVRALAESEARTAVLRNDLAKLKVSHQKELSYGYWREFGRMAATRRQAAEYFLKRSSDPSAAEKVLDFFDINVGRELKRGHLDVETLYKYFYHWVQHYWHASQELFKSRKDDTQWQEFPSLYYELSQFRQQENPCYDKELVPADEELLEFLKKEAVGGAVSPAQPDAPIP